MNFGVRIRDLLVAGVKNVSFLLHSEELVAPKASQILNDIRHENPTFVDNLALVSLLS